MFHLRFPGFQEEWEIASLGKIAEFSKGKGISKSDIDEEGSTECIRYGELYTLYGEVIAEVKSRTNIDKSYLVLSEVNDVIIPASGETQIDIATASCVLKSGVALGGDLNIIKTPNNGIFLSYYLNSKKKIEIANLAQGISVVHLYSSQLALLQISLPSIVEQDKVASFLSLLDQRIATQNKIIEDLKLLKSALVHRLINTGKSHSYLRFSEFQEECEKKKLGEITKIYDGTHQTPNYVKNGIPFYSVEQVTSNNFDNTKFISEEVFQIENKRVKLEYGDILMTRIGDIGTIKYIDWDVSASFYVSLVLIKCNQEKVNSKYLSHFMQTVFFQNELWQRTIHVAFPKKINLGEIGDCDTFIPSFLEQQKIAHILSLIDEKIEVEKKLLIKCTEQKKYLLGNLFI